VQFTIYNNGIGDMNDPLNFIVIEDIIMYRMDEFQLIAGDSTNIRVEANGATWRIETELPDNYPDVDQPFSTVETCGGFNNPGLVNAFPLYDRAPFRDINCTEAVGSFDPNDKQAAPKGFGPENRIRANTDLEYKIRFQNTGTDTAFRVVIIDTLSTLLDFASLRVGASSHPYQVKVFEGGILHIVFDPIALPDSNINEPASHGFISFRVSQQPNLPNGTIFHNTASIYFDFNEAVVTNTVTHTIGELEQVVVSGVSHLPTNTPPLNIQPNPMQDDATIDLPDGISTLQIFNNQGVMVQNTTVFGKQYQLHKNELGAGMYYLKLVNEGNTLAHGKLIVL
jgi:uncharacterized repeat protein (TIGR01451 family)